LCGYALLGGVDIGYFHIYRYRLYKIPSSREEHLTHLARELLFSAALAWVIFVKAGGTWSIVLPALLGLDFLVCMVDVLLEPRSRAPLGGLPPLEYAIHMACMFLSGAVLATAIHQSLKTLPLETSFHLETLQLPLPLVGLGMQILLVSMGFFFYEGIRFVRGR